MNTDRGPQACVLGLDIGTSGVRVVALSDAGTLVGHAHAEFEKASQADGATQDPSIWWSATLLALRAVGERVELSHIRALAIDGTSGTILAVDERGRPLGRARMYNDKALASTVGELDRILPEDSPARGATSPLARMIEMQREGAYKMLHQADWLTGQFTGRFDVSDENNALKSGFDLMRRTWPAWLGDTPLDPKLLPQVVPPGTDLGRIRPELAAECGLSLMLRIVSGTTDGCASFIASGARDYGDAVTSLGTTLTLKQLCDKPVASARFGVYSHRLGDRWLCGGASNTGGAVLLQFFTREQLIQLEPRMTPGQLTNLDYYPLPSTGERFPHADASREPRMAPRPADDAQFLQGLFEGIASIEKAGYSRLQEFGAPALKRVVTVGGGAHNQAWRRIRQHFLGVPIETGESDAAHGTAMLALSAVSHKSVFASD